jgi:DNA-binding CsgD family transcriptional regulator
MQLVDRRAECAQLDLLVSAVTAGESRALVLSGAPGVGKTALLEYVAGQASECRIARIAGVQSEMELAFAGLHQLCAPMLHRIQSLPAAQRDALRIAFGMTSGPAPDRFLIGLAVLNLLSDVEEKQPLICLIDDEQWLDRASAQVLAFVARRLVTESVGLVFAARVVSRDMAGLPNLTVEGLPETAARALLDSVVTGPLDARIRDRILAETRGNPLALLELPGALTSQHLDGGFGFPGAAQLSAGVEGSFRQRVDILPDETRLLLLVAAAEPIGDPSLVWPAAARLGIGGGAAAPAVEAGLVEFDPRVRFRHPLVRSAVYEAASVHQRQHAHAALAEVTDPWLDPDRRAWHRANAAIGPDEGVAMELEQSADRARARGGFAAAAAFLERATTLTVDSARRTERALAAASADVKAGAFDEARKMVSVAEARPHTDFQQARIDLIDAELAFLTSRGGDVPALLLKAAKRLEPIDARLARATYLSALASGYFAGRLAVGASALDVARAAVGAPPPQDPRAPDLFLAGLVMHYTTGYEAGLPILRKALHTFGIGESIDEELRWHWVAGIVARHVWDDKSWQSLSDQHVQLARRVGALSELPVALNSRAFMLMFAGDLTGAASLLQELEPAIEATGTHLTPYAALGLAALGGRDAEAAAMIESITTDATLRGEGIGLSIVEWAGAVMNNGIGDYDAAVSAAEYSGEHVGEMTSPPWGAVEYIEAAARSGRPDRAADVLRRLAAITGASGTDWARGVEARSRALLSDGEPAEAHYRESIERLGRTRIRADLARAHLLYGEWLRRERRRIDARVQLRIAVEMLESMGMEAFAERGRRELQATGEKARKRTVVTAEQTLTTQEAQIARMARDGLSNPEIGARLFISARTVQHHLRKVFMKLGITSRSQLDHVLPA